MQSPNNYSLSPCRDQKSRQRNAGSFLVSEKVKRQRQRDMRERHDRKCDHCTGV